MLFGAGSSAQPYQPQQNPYAGSSGGQSYQYTPPPTFSSSQGSSGGGSFLDNLWGGITNTLSGAFHLGNGAPAQFLGKALGPVEDTFTKLSNAESTPQRAILQAGSNFLTGGKGPNYMDYTQDPGSLLTDQLGGKNLPGPLHFGASLLGDVATDPLTYLSLGSADLPKIALQGGRDVTLSRAGVDALKSTAFKNFGTTDLAKLETEQPGALAKVQQAVAQHGVTQAPHLLDKGGVKFAGKSVIPQSAFDAVGSGINKATQPLVNTRVGQAAGGVLGGVNDWRKMVFDKNMTSEGPLAAKEAQSIQQKENVTNLARTKLTNWIQQHFPSILPHSAEDYALYNILKPGLQTTIDRASSIGKSVEQLAKENPDVPVKSLQAFHSLINHPEGLQLLEQIAHDEWGLDAKHLGQNYMHDFKPDLITKREKYGAQQMGSKINSRDRSSKQKVESLGLNSEQAREKGFSGSAIEGLGQTAYKRFAAQENNRILRNIITDPELSQKIDPQALYEAGKIADPTLKQAIHYMKTQGHAIYQPEGNLKFFKVHELDQNGNVVKDEFGKDKVEGVHVTSKVPTYATSKPLGAKLNEVRVGDARQIYPSLHGMQQLSNNLLKGEFVDPGFAAVHIGPHLGVNHFLQTGFNDILHPGIVSKTANDIKNNSKLFKAVQERGGLPHAYDHKSETVEQLINQAAKTTQQKTQLKSLYDKTLGHVITNPFGDNWVANRVLTHSDNFLRMAGIRNAIEKNGMTIDQAIAHTNKYMVKYNNLTKDEKGVFRLFFPFYAWTKGNLGAQKAAILAHNWRYMLPQRVLNIANEALTGHTMAGNDQGHQQDLALGTTDAKGNPTYLKNSMSTNDVPSLINNKIDFFMNRASQLGRAGTTLATGVDTGGYPVVNQDSGTGKFTQRVTGAVNQLLPFNKQAALLERKYLGIGLDPSQYPDLTQAPKSLGDTLKSFALGRAGVTLSNPSPDSKKSSYNQYYQQKYEKSLRKKGIL